MTAIIPDHPSFLSTGEGPLYCIKDLVPVALHDATAARLEANRGIITACQAAAQAASAYSVARDNFIVARNAYDKARETLSKSLDTIESKSHSSPAR